jgi:acetoin utilization deacetylase AcuC-like enzyme
VGFADERGSGPGDGATCNRPLPPGSGDDDWLAALDDVLASARAHGAEAIVVSLGVDAAGVDPESPLEVTTAGFRAAGERLAGLDRPTVLVHEGGYDLSRLGGDTVAVLGAFGVTSEGRG